MHSNSEAHQSCCVCSPRAVRFLSGTTYLTPSPHCLLPSPPPPLWAVVRDRESLSVLLVRCFGVSVPHVSDVLRFSLVSVGLTSRGVMIPRSVHVASGRVPSLPTAGSCSVARTHRSRSGRRPVAGHLAGSRVRVSCALSPGRRAPQQGCRLCLEPPSAWRIGQRVPATAAGVGGSQHTGEGLGQGRVRVLTRGFFRAPVLAP